MTSRDEPLSGAVPAAGSALRRSTRRQFLGSLGRSAGALALSSLLPGCNPFGGRGAQDAHVVDWKEWWSAQGLAGILDFANWPYYIDRTRDNTHPSLLRFTAESGINVNYYRPIRDNAHFLDRIRPSLEAGKPIGYDLIVITTGPQLSELMGNDWLTPLDHTHLTHFARFAGPLVRNPAWDPGNRFSVAWQSGLTGIAYRPEAVQALGRAPNSIRDLWDPVFVGRVGMLTDLMDLGSFGLLALGVDPQTSSMLDWHRAADLLMQQWSDGLVRKYYDQGYLFALQKGDTWISQAWSGDIFQANQLGHPELSFVVPEEGAMFWTDNMLIPRGAAHPLDAITYMDFVYRPQIAAMIADWVWYMTPVPAARPIILNRFGDTAVAESPLVFPDKELLGKPVTISFSGGSGGTRQTTVYENSRVRQYYVFADQFERQEWQRAFGPVIGE